MQQCLALSVLTGVVLAAWPACATQALTLEQAWVQAYSGNPSLEAERAKLRATDEQVSLALAHWRPSIDVTANVGKTYQYLPAQKAFGTADFADTTRGYGIEVTQPLFRGFRTLSETEAAEKQVLAERAKLDETEEQLLLDTAKSFLDIIRDQTILGIDGDNETVLQQKLEETKVRAQIGDLSQTDVQQAASRLARAQVTRLQTERVLMADRSAFTRLVGAEPGSLVKPELAIETTGLDGVLSLAEARNPGVISAQYVSAEANAQIGQSRGALLPELDLVGSSARNYGENATLPGRFDSSQILLQLKIPIYDAGSDYARVRQAQQTAVQRRMELEQARRRAQESASNGWQALSLATAAVHADERVVESAARALEGVQAQSQVGTRTVLDVLNAEQELLDAKTDLAKSEHDKGLAVVQIKAAIGELTANALHLPLTPYDPDRHYQDARAGWLGFDEAEDDVYTRPHPENAAAQ